MRRINSWKEDKNKEKNRRKKECRRKKGRN